MVAAAVLAVTLPFAQRTDLGAAVEAVLARNERTPAALRRAIEDGGASAQVADFYRAHRYQPLWIVERRLRPEAVAVISMIEGASADGLNPGAYGLQALRNAVPGPRDDDPASLARAELALSEAYSAYVSDLRRPPVAGRMAWRDPALPTPPADPRQVLEAAVAAPDLGRAVAAARRMHPIYLQLRAELAARRAAGAPEALEMELLANMARARALPADPGPRYILVDAAAQRMWLYENGQPVDSMRTIVGTPLDQTPAMAGLMRYAKFRPYWNIPEDIAREEIAPRVLREGTGYLARQNFQVLSDWSPSARVVDPSAVDWRAVASGAISLRMRRLPGRMNVLGKMKFMLPNPLGIYLHDTPNKRPFRSAQRTISHGCIRLEDAPRLARRLIGPEAENPPPGDDVTVDLPQPVPVYITYFTLAPGPGGLERRPDVYRRDAALIAELAGKERVAAD